MSGSSMVERTIAPTFGTFAWEEQVPVFLTEVGAPTFDDTGTPLVRKKTGEQAVGTVVRTAERGESVLLPEEVAAAWDGRGAFAEDGPTEAVTWNGTEAVPVDEAPELADGDVFSATWLAMSTAVDVLTAVGDDAGRAEQMAAIEADAPKPRTSLITRLQKIK